MYVKIGKYPRSLSYLIRKNRFFDWINGNIIAKINDFFEQRRVIRISIDYHDMWDINGSLSYVINQFVQEFKKKSDGWPMILYKDIPDYLKRDYDKILETEEETYRFILEEICFAFEHQVKYDELDDMFTTGKADYSFEPCENKEFVELKMGPNHTLEVDKEGLERLKDRIKRGRLLFAEYYNSFWI